MLESIGVDFSKENEKMGGKLKVGGLPIMRLQDRHNIIVAV